MTIARVVEEYVVYKRSLGMAFQSSALRLNRFVRFVGDVEIEQITPEKVREFLQRTTASEWFMKYSSLGPFYRYAIARGYTTGNPLPTVQPKQPPDFQPFIYSVENVQRMLQAVEGRCRGSWHMEPYTVRMLLLLLYGTGLRIGEALRLTHQDVNLAESLLTIRETKFYKSRLVPVGADLTVALRAYFERKWSAQACTPQSPFLATYNGRPVTRQTAELTFQRVRTEAGVRRTDGARFQPRLHDFRHTFAVTRLLTWYREGKNVQRLLPHLATYLGHGRLQETTRYLTMTMNLLEEASRRFEQYAQPTGGAA
jgi:integrase/recombinase XerD